MIEKTDFTEKLGNLYRDISDIKFTESDSMESLLDKFYAVMSKWGICKNTWTEHGSMCGNNPEWCICYMAFISLYQSNFDFKMLLNTPPKHLLAYGSSPHDKTSKRI